MASLMFAKASSFVSPSLMQPEGRVQQQCNRLRRCPPVSPGLSFYIASYPLKLCISQQPSFGSVTMQIILTPSRNAGSFFPLSASCGLSWNSHSKSEVGIPHGLHDTLRMAPPWSAPLGSHLGVDQEDHVMCLRDVSWRRAWGGEVSRTNSTPNPHSSCHSMHVHGTLRSL